MTDLQDRINANPVAASMQSLAAAQADLLQTEMDASNSDASQDLIDAAIGRCRAGVAAAESAVDVAIADDADREINAVALALRTIADDQFTGWAIGGWLRNVAARVESGAAIDDAVSAQNSHDRRNR